MSKGNTFETDILKLILQNVDAALIGDATGVRGSSVAGSVYVSLHTADPGEAGDQTTSEVGTGAYASYARVAVVRSAAGWTVTGNNADNAAVINFPLCTGGTGASLTHFAVGVSVSGVGKILYKGALGSPLAVSNGITPQFAIGALDITED